MESCIHSDGYNRLLPSSFLTEPSLSLSIDLILDAPRNSQALQSPLLFQILATARSCCLLKCREKSYQKWHSQPWEIVHFPPLGISVPFMSLWEFRISDERRGTWRGAASSRYGVSSVQSWRSSAEITTGICKVYKNYSINICNRMEMMFLPTVFKTLLQNLTDFQIEPSAQMHLE